MAGVSVPNALQPLVEKRLLRPHEARIFLSSGSDLRAKRDFFERLVRTAELAFEQSRFGASMGIRLRVDRWEDVVPQLTGGDTNARFVKMAQDSHITVVLLSRDLRPGTKREIEAVLAAEGDVLLAVIWMEPRSGEVAAGLTRFLRRHQEHFLYAKTTTRSEDVANEMVKTIVHTIGVAIDRHGGSDEFFEVRS